TPGFRVALAIASLPGMTRWRLYRRHRFPIVWSNRRYKMAKHGFKILDSDMHIMEPPDLWDRYIEDKYKARAPRGVTSENVRDLRMVYPNGKDWARKSTRISDSARGHNFERNQ